MKLLDDEYAQNIKENRESGGKICLDFDIYARAIVKLAVKTNEPITFGIYGEWGTGKTTLMHAINNIFDDEYSGEVYTVWFNPWEYPPEENMVKALLQTMLAQEWYPTLSNGKEKVRTALQTLLKLLSSAIPGVPDMEEIELYLDKISSQEELKPSSFMSLRKVFEKFITHLININSKEGAKLVFFVDDLDRCLPQKIVGMLENIRLIFNFKNCIFFVGADRQIVADGINYFYNKDSGTGVNIEKNSATFNGDRYLEKMIQVPFFIPQNDTKKIGEYFDSFKDFDEEKRNTLFEILQVTETNPRKIKRIINSIILSWTTFNLSLSSAEDSSKNSEDFTDLTILAILKVIQLQWPGFFRELERGLDNRVYLNYLLNDMNTRSNKEYQPEKRFEEQNDGIKETLKNYNIKANSILTFFRKNIVKESLFGPNKLDKLAMYLRSTRGFLQEAPETKTTESEIPTKIELLIEAFGRNDIREFNKLRQGIKNTRLNFSSENFKGFSLRYVNFSNCDLLETNFEECDLENADFSNADLTGSNLSNTNCQGANFTNATMGYVNVKDANLTNAKFDNTEMEYTNWWQASDKNDDMIRKSKSFTELPTTEDEEKSWRENFSNYHSLSVDEDT